MVKLFYSGYFGDRGVVVVERVDCYKEVRV